MNAITNPMMTAIEGTTPLVMSALDLNRGKIGLIVVDEVHGFCTPGRGPLAPAVPNPQIERMIEETDLLARRIGPKLVFRDSHTAEQDEKPYPPHCLVGTGDDMLVSRLEWLENDPETLVMPKECINGVIGGIRPDGSNIVFDWAKASGVDTLVLVGICTDICVLTAAVSLLSARTRGFIGKVDQIIVHEPACATYDLPLATAVELGLPASSAHPQDLFHQMGLLIMQNQGAIITDRVL